MNHLKNGTIASGAVGSRARSRAVFEDLWKTPFLVKGQDPYTGDSHEYHASIIDVLNNPGNVRQTDVITALINGLLILKSRIEELDAHQQY